MIFVTVGASQFPFDRLLHAVDELELEEELVVQHGPSAIRPGGARCFDFMSFEDVARHVREARAVVSHGGIGSVLVALAEGKRPLVVPRLRRFGETVDDHQAESARQLDAAGLVTAVFDPDELARVLPAPGEVAWAPQANGGGLVSELRDYVCESVAGAAS